MTLGANPLMRQVAAEGPRGPTPELLKCCTCKRMKPKEKMKAANGDWSKQCRCEDCNALRGRVDRLKAHDIELKAGYASFNDDAREQFFANSAGLFNAELKTALTTAITKSYLERLTQNMQADGIFEDY